MKSFAAVLFVGIFTLCTGEADYSPYGRIALKLPKSHQNSDASKIVNEKLLARVAEIYSQGGDGSEDGQQENEGDNIVNSELIARIARIISQNEGQTSPFPPAPEGPAITQDYGVPQEITSKLVGMVNFELGQPQVAKRIASFDFTVDDQDFNKILGGYSTQYQNSDAYPSELPSREGNARFMFIATPQMAERIAAFDIPEGEQQTGYSQNSNH